MEERKFIRLKKEEFGIKEYIKRNLGKGKISRLDIEYTPIGEKIIILTSRPGLVIGRRGEKIEELTRVLKTRFKLENPHIEISEIKNPLFDAQLVADEIAMALERMGNLKFKVIAYRKLSEIMKAGALGCEIRLTGKLPSERARPWRFAEGYLKKAGESRKEINRAQAVALNKTGIIGIKVAIMAPDARVYDRIEIDDKIKEQIRSDIEKPEEEIKKIKKPRKKKIEIEEKTGEEKSKQKLIEPKEEKEEKIKVIKESQDIKPEEDGTAMKIEEELEEGVPQEVIDEEIKQDLEKHKEKEEEEKRKRELEKEKIEKEKERKKKEDEKRKKELEAKRKREAEKKELEKKKQIEIKKQEPKPEITKPVEQKIEIKPETKPVQEIKQEEIKKEPKLEVTKLIEPKIEEKQVEETKLEKEKTNKEKIIKQIKEEKPESKPETKETEKADELKQEEKKEETTEEKQNLEEKQVGGQDGNIEI